MIINTVVSGKKGASADSTIELPIQTSTSGNNISLFDGDYTATLSNASSGQTLGFKNDVFIVKDQNDSDSVVISKTETFPSGNFKSAVMSSTSVYLDDTKSSIVGTVDDEGFDVTYSASTSSSDGSVTVSDGYHYNNETDAPFYLSSDLTRSATQMVVHPEDFVETPNQQKQGTLFLTKPTATTTSSVIVANSSGLPRNNYTVNGTLTINDGIASGFSSSNYITTTGGDTGQGVEAVVKFTTNSYLYSRNISGGSTPLKQESSGIYFYNTAQSYWEMVAGPFTSERTFWMKIVKTGTTFDFYLTNDGTTWTLSHSLTSNQSSIGFSTIGKADSDAFLGTIDLNEWYIKDSNGDIIWQAISPAQPIGPVDTSKEYCGSVVDPINKGKVVTMDTTLTKILAVE